jgi:hypothetical protein
LLIAREQIIVKFALPFGDRLKDKIIFFEEKTHEIIESGLDLFRNVAFYKC